MNELDGSDDERPTSEGSDGPQYGGDDGGEEMGSPFARRHPYNVST